MILIDLTGGRANNSVSLDIFDFHIMMELFYYKADPLIALTVVVATIIVMIVAVPVFLIIRKISKHTCEDESQREDKNPHLCSSCPSVVKKSRMTLEKALDQFMPIGHSGGYIQTELVNPIYAPVIRQSLRLLTTQAGLPDHV